VSRGEIELGNDKEEKILRNNGVPGALLFLMFSVSRSLPRTRSNQCGIPDSKLVQVWLEKRWRGIDMICRGRPRFDKVCEFSLL
jgi:hypothetical protein